MLGPITGLFNGNQTALLSATRIVSCDGVCSSYYSLGSKRLGCGSARKGVWSKRRDFYGNVPLSTYLYNPWQANLLVPLQSIFRPGRLGCLIHYSCTPFSAESRHLQKPRVWGSYNGFVHCPPIFVMRLIAKMIVDAARSTPEKSINPSQLSLSPSMAPAMG